MVFPSLDGPLGGVATVLMGRDTLKVNIVFAEGFFDFCGAFVIEQVKFWSVAVDLQFVEDALPCVTY